MGKMPEAQNFLIPPRTSELLKTNNCMEYHMFRLGLTLCAAVCHHLTYFCHVPYICFFFFFCYIYHVCSYNYLTLLCTILYSLHQNFLGLWRYFEKFMEQAYKFHFAL